MAHFYCPTVAMSPYKEHPLEWGLIYFPKNKTLWLMIVYLALTHQRHREGNCSPMIMKMTIINPQSAFDERSWPSSSPAINIIFSFPSIEHPLTTRDLWLYACLVSINWTVSILLFRWPTTTTSIATQATEERPERSRGSSIEKMASDVRSFDLHSIQDENLLRKMVTRSIFM